MPYIKPDDRKLLSEIPFPANVGELNYLITCLCCDYLGATKISYAHFNEVIGVLECVKMELYRRLLAPYEDKKMVENGDVFSPFLITPPVRGETDGPNRRDPVQAGQAERTEVQ